MKICVLDKCTVTNSDISLDELDKLGQVKYFDIVTDEKIPEAIGDAEGVICNKAKITERIMELCPKLKFIGLFATGYNNIDIKAAAARGICVCNVPGYSTDSVAQQVFAFMLHFACGADIYSGTVMRGDWVKSKTFSYFSYPITELCGKTLGIFGFGTIGKKVAAIALAFGMKVIAYSRTEKKLDGVRFVNREELFSQSDYLTLHCPLNEQTKNTVNGETLSLMKNTAVLINTARGGCVDEKALCDALNGGKIRGAGIDVLADEPMYDGHPYLNAKNIFITPHVAWASLEARTRLIHEVAENVKSFEAGETRNKVN